MIKRILALVVLITVVLAGNAQATHDFSAVNDDGVTLYYKILDEAKKEVTLTIPNFTNNPYYVLTKMVIPDKVKKSDGTEYTVTDVGETFVTVDLLHNEYDNLIELILPSTLKTLMWQPFGGIKNVKKFILPAGLKEANGIIFQFATNNTVEEIHLLPIIPPPAVGYPAFNMDVTNIKIYVPQDCSVNYKANEDWKVNALDFTTDVPYLEQVSVGPTGYTSYYLENENFEVPAGCTAYIITGVTGNQAVVKAFGAGKIIPKQTGFILQGTPNTTIGYRAAITGTEENVANNLLVGTASGQEFNSAGNKYYVLANGADGIGFYHQGTRKGKSIRLKAHSAGLSLPVSPGTPAKGIIIDFAAAEPAVTVIDTPAADVLEKNVIYNLQGQRVARVDHGIYIINGKKVIK